MSDKNENVRTRIKQFVDSQGISQKDFFDDTGLSRGLLDTDKLNKDVGADKITNILVTYKDLSAEWLMTGLGEMLKTKDAYLRDTINVSQEVSQQDYKSKKAKSVILSNKFVLQTDRIKDHQIVPIYNIEAAAGLVALLDNPKSETVIDYISIPNLPNCDGALYVTGDSMYPLLKSGDIVAYKNVIDIKNDIFYGEMYILSLDMSGEEVVTIKFVQKGDKNGYIKLVSQNKHHADKDVKLEKIRALALIKASIRYNMMY